MENINLSESFELSALVDFQTNSIVSKELVKKKTGTITLFAFDQGQGLSEHTAPFDASVFVMEGKADINIGEKANEVFAGQMIVMPANVPHALFAKQKFKMMLIMIRE